jgi:hypothetical protein
LISYIEKEEEAEIKTAYQKQQEILANIGTIKNSAGKKLNKH